MSLLTDLTIATASYLATVHADAPVHHMSPAPLSQALFPNIKPMAHPIIPRPALPLPLRFFSHVYSLSMPSQLPEADLPRLLRNISDAMRPGGRVYLTLCEPLPVPGKVGPILQTWLDEHLLKNLRERGRCIEPNKMFPDWLFEAGLRAYGSLQAKVTFAAVHSPVKMPLGNSGVGAIIADYVSSEAPTLDDEENSGSSSYSVHPCISGLSNPDEPIKTVGPLPLPPPPMPPLPKTPVTEKKISPSDDSKAMPPPPLPMTPVTKKGKEKAKDYTTGVGVKNGESKIMPPPPLPATPATEKKNDTSVITVIYTGPPRETSAEKATTPATTKTPVAKTPALRHKPKMTKLQEREARAELRSLVGVMLWQSTWGDHVTAETMWWDDPDCVKECKKLGTEFDYYMIEGVKTDFQEVEGIVCGAKDINGKF